MKIDIDNHGFVDFTNVYKFLIDRYTPDDDSCPAVLFVDDTETMIYASEEGDEVIILNRESPDLRRDLRNIIRKTPIKLKRTEEEQLPWNSCLNYAAWYYEAYNICQYLKIEMPALWFYKNRLHGIDLDNVCYSSEKSGYRVTDMFIRSDNISHPDTVLKMLLHELRHTWQHKYHNEWFEDYSFNRGEKDQDEKYCLQKAEVDADAFAYWTMEQNGMRFSYDPGSEQHMLIKYRMAEILEEEIMPLSLCMIKKNS